MNNDKGDYTTPDRERSALLIIDVQRDFTIAGATAEIPGTLQAVPYIQRLVQTYRELGYPIVHVVRLYHAEGSNVDLCRRKAIENGMQLVIPGSDGAELMNELMPSAPTHAGGSIPIRLDSNLLLSGHLQHIGSLEWIMYKPRWGAFYDTMLNEHLHNLNVNTVVVCGCNYPNCPRTTIYEASERDFKIILVNDATSLFYDIASKELINIGVTVMNADECISWLGVSSYSKPESY